VGGGKKRISSPFTHELFILGWRRNPDARYIARVAIHILYRAIFKIWRKKRQHLFSNLLKPMKGDCILDVGGLPGCWEEAGLSGVSINCLNPDKKAVKGPQNQRENIFMLEGDGCDLPCADKSYSIVFSNSVIEHVGDWSRQRKFAGEVRRVGQRVWVQTPAYECFIEPHFLCPFFHWLPVAWRIRTGRWATLWGWLEKPSPQRVREMVEEIRLLKKKEFQELFPDCEIITEKFFGMLPKSYIAVRKA